MIPTTYRADLLPARDTARGDCHRIEVTVEGSNLRTIGKHVTKDDDVAPPGASISGVRNGSICHGENRMAPIGAPVPIPVLSQVIAATCEIVAEALQVTVPSALRRTNRKVELIGR